MKKHNGFTLVELMVVVSIVGILVGTATPLYTRYIEKARFTEVISMAAYVKTAIGVCVAEKGALTDCNSYDKVGIVDPASNGNLKYTDWISFEGKTSTGKGCGSGITTFKAKGNALVDNATYVMTGKLDGSVIHWTVSGTCVNKGLC